MEAGSPPTDQLSLFRDPMPAAELQQQPPLLSPLLRLGTSTWTYEGWQGLVYTRQYPPGRFKRDCLAEYARYLFRTVGFDASFLWAALRTSARALRRPLAR
jgi:hypothetical protein